MYFSLQLSAPRSTTTVDCSLQAASPSLSVVTSRALGASMQSSQTCRRITLKSFGPNPRAKIGKMSVIQNISFELPCLEKPLVLAPRTFKTTKSGGVSKPVSLENYYYYFFALNIELDVAPRRNAHAVGKCRHQAYEAF